MHPCHGAKALGEQRVYRDRSRQRGMALITVMLILALAVILATEIASRLNYSMRRAENWQLRQQGQWYALGAEALARQVLTEDIRSNPDKTWLGQNWAIDEQYFPVDEVMLRGGISDLHSCFNVNALAELPPDNPPSDWEPQARPLLEKLLTALNLPDLPAFEAEMLSYALQDWVDADQVLAGSFGAEDSDYVSGASGSSGYLTPDVPLSWQSELRPVRGMSASLMQQLAPYLCVRPADRELAVNINTLSVDHPEVLYAVLDGKVSMADIRLLLEERSQLGDKSYNAVSDFMAEPVFSGLDESDKTALAARLTVRSSWFLLDGSVSSEQGQFRLSSLFYAGPDTGDAQQQGQQNSVSVVSRKYGGAW